MDIHEKAITEKGLHAAWPQPILLEEPLLSRDMLETVMGSFSADVKLFNKDCELLDRLIKDGQGDEIGNHERLDIKTYGDLELFVRELARDSDKTHEDAGDRKIPPQEGNASIVSGLTTRELCGRLQELLAKTTSNYLMIYRYTVPEIARSEICLNQEVAIIPQPKELERIIRYREHLYRTREKLLEQFHKAEESGRSNESPETTDAEYWDEPPDNPTS